MKIVGIILISSCLSVAASDALSRIGGFTGGREPAVSQPRTTRGFSRNLLVDPFRKVDGRRHDLRPLMNWANAGLSTPSTQPYTVPNPMPDWQVVEGRIIQVIDEGVLVVRGETVCLVRNWPGKAKAVDNDEIDVLALRAGTFQYRSTAGASKTIAAYDYGQLPTKEERVQMQAAAVERFEAARVARETADEQKKAAAEAKVVDFLKRRADQGSASAQYDLALRYLEGRGVEENREQAATLLDAAAKQGHADAVRKLKAVEARSLRKD